MEPNSYPFTYEAQLEFHVSKKEHFFIFGKDDIKYMKQIITHLLVWLNDKIKFYFIEKYCYYIMCYIFLYTQKHYIHI